jgi:hypothetical protein
VSASTLRVRFPPANGARGRGSVVRKLVAGRQIARLA